MAVISLSITESNQQIISGIPRNVSISANIPSTIFYTLDGTTPTSISSVYVGPISLPTNNSSVMLQIYATNGVDYSPVVSRMYAPSTVDLRRPRDTVIGLTPEINSINLAPYGSNVPSTPVKYGRTGGITVDAPDVPNIPDGYDGITANSRSNGTDLPLSSYTFLYSERNSKGESGHGIGTLPENVTTIRVPETKSVSESSNTSDRFFNPRAMVIYQDSRHPPYDDVPQLNRAHFSLQNLERSRDGALLLNNANNSSSVTGNFLRQHFNPKDNTVTYYYRDSDSGRWIISVEPFAPKNNNIGALHNITFSGRENASPHVYRWVPFMSRKLT